MRDRHNTLLWMKDLIEHMTHCHDQLQWAGEGSTQTYLADTLMVDLAQCQRLCEELRSRPRQGRALAASI